MSSRIAAIVWAVLAAAAVSAEEPSWLKEARAREAEPRREKKLKSPDKFFTARVPAKPVGKVSVEEGLYRVALDAGAASPIHCTVMVDPPDMANVLVATSKQSFDALAQAYGKVSGKAVERVDAGTVGSTPFLAIDWMYRVESKDKPAAVGGLKQLVASKGGHTVFCAHDELGFAATFRSVSLAFVESIAFRDAPATASYRTEISTMAFKGMRVGVAQTTFTRDEDGDTRIENLSSVLLPVTQDTLSATDEVSIEWARPDGSLINAHHVENENGEITTQLKLSPREEGGWTVSGTFKTKPISATLPDSSPTSTLGDVLALQAELATPPAKRRVIRAKSWVAGVNPRKLTPQELAIGKSLAANRHAAKLSAAGLNADLVVDSAGSVVSATMALGPIRMELERTFEEGAISATFPASPQRE